VAGVGAAAAVAVIGAGNVGHALAGDLALRGVEVRLFSRSPERLEPIRRAGGIAVSGEVEGFAPVGLVTQSLKDAVDGAGVVAVCLSTVALPAYAEALGEASSSDQVIWLNPGHTGGALYLAAAWSRSSGIGERKLCQLTTASHVSRMTGPAAVRVFLLPRAAVAALPAHHLDECHALLDMLLPGQLGRAGSILENDLANINAIMHPPGMVCNAGWIQATDGEFGFYADGATPAVSAVMDEIDHERLTLAERLDVPAVPFAELLHQLGFSASDRATSAREAIEHSELIYPIRSPAALDHRYLHEDVGWGLVPWTQLAQSAGLPTPAAAAVSHLAGVINGVDYAREGLTLERMGLAEMTIDQIAAYIGRR
jgi:opine dehydrogenase